MVKAITTRYGGQGNPCSTLPTFKADRVAGLADGILMAGGAPVQVEHSIEAQAPMDHVAAVTTGLEEGGGTSPKR